MSLRKAVQEWNEFFFAPRSPLPVCFFRILFGACVVVTLLLLGPDWLNWYGAHSWVALAGIQKIEPVPRLDLFAVLPQTDASAEFLFWFFLVFAVLLSIGLFTRVSCIATFLCLTSMQQREPLIWHSGDTFLRVAGFFLMFAPAGAALSVDRVLRLRAHKESAEIAPRSPWAQRMIQLQLATLYFMSFCSKSMGSPWVDGTALYYAFHLASIQRFPLPGWALQPLVLKLGSWFTLAFEFAMGVLVWFKELRYPLLLTGLVFHLFLEYTFNIPMFQWDVLSAYVLFVDPADFERAGRWVRQARPNSLAYPGPRAHES